MEEKPTRNKYIDIQNVKKTQQKEFAGPAHRPRPPMTIGTAAALLAAASSSQLDCCADGEKCHSSPPLRRRTAGGSLLVPFLLFISFFPASFNSFFKHFFTPYQDITNCCASFYAQSLYCKFSFSITSSQKRKKERESKPLQSNSFPVSVATTHFELYRPKRIFFCEMRIVFCFLFCETLHLPS